MEAQLCPEPAPESATPKPNWFQAAGCGADDYQGCGHRVVVCASDYADDPLSPCHAYGESVQNPEPGTTQLYPRNVSCFDVQVLAPSEQYEANGACAMGQQNGWSCDGCFSFTEAADFADSGVFKLFYHASSEYAYLYNLAHDDWTQTRDCEGRETEQLDDWDGESEACKAFCVSFGRAGCCKMNTANQNCRWHEGRSTTTSARDTRWAFDIVEAEASTAPRRVCFGLVAEPPAPPWSPSLCLNTCGQQAEWASDGACDDGGPGSDDALCDHGTDCNDCGTRAYSLPSPQPRSSPAPPPQPP